MIGIGAFVACFAVIWAVAAFLAPALIRPVPRLATRIALRSGRFVPSNRHRGMRWLSTYWPVLVIVSAGGLLAIWAGDGFFDVAQNIRAHSPIGQRIDQVTYDWLRSHRDRVDTVFFTGATMFGSPVSLAIIVVAVASALSLRRRYGWAAYLAGTVAGGAILDEVLKRHFVRARPDLAIAMLSARGYSFPSGHAMGSTIVFGALTYLGMRGLRRWPAKSALFAFSVTTILTIAFSRIYLGVHWISDVAAGIAAGFTWLAATTTAYETVRRLRVVRARLRISRGSEIIKPA